MPTLTPQSDPSPDDEVIEPTADASPDANTEVHSPEAEHETAPSTVDTNTQGDTKPTDLRSLISNVVKGGDADSPSADKAAETDTPGATQSKPEQANPSPSGDKDASEDANADGTEKGDENLPFHKHPRWQAVIAERDSYKEDATQFREIGNFMAENHVSPEDVNNSLEIAALIRTGRPEEALKRLVPMVQQLQLLTGEYLPDDLRSQVEDGEMPEAAAQELARTRAQLQAQTEQRQQEESLRQRQSAAQAHQAVVNAAIDWETRIAGSDPDYAAKRAIVHEKIELANLKSPARTPQEAVAIAEAAYAEANRLVKGLVPQRKEIKQPLASQTTPRTAPAPRSLRDVVARAVT